MVGRLTSQDPARTAGGVLYQDILTAERAASARLIKSLVAALQAWQDYEELRRRTHFSDPKVKALRRAAIQLTARALS